MPDVIILGSGPAGISAALYTARAGLSTLVVSSGAGALAKTDRIENYYGFPEPVSGGELVKNGIRQARRVGATVVRAEVVGLSFDGGFRVETRRGVRRAPFAVLATGASRTAPRIPGLTEYEGRGVSYCAVCDAFFYKKKPVAVLGAGSYALHEALELLPVASSVTVLTNGAEPETAFPSEIRIETKKVAALTGEKGLSGVVLEGGEKLAAAGVFVAVGVAGSVDLARKIGAATNGTAVIVDEKRRTNVPGLYAAGDCTGGLLQISKAVCDGAVAGTDVVRAFRACKKS